MRRETVVKVILAEVELESIQSHGTRDVDPPPEIAPGITTLAGPPVTLASFSARGSKMLHEQAGVDCDQDARAEPAEEAQYLAGTI